MSITNLKPYDYRLKQTAGFLRRNVYSIRYEGREVRTVEGFNEDEVDGIILLLNAAYQLGFSDGTVQGYNNDLPVLHHELPGL
jgi:hypothetical protein